MSGWEWFGVIAASASVATLALASIFGWFAKRTAPDIHAAAQLTLTDMRKGFSDSQERLSQILERMDQRADERHREVLQAIQALKG